MFEEDGSRFCFKNGMMRRERFLRGLGCAWLQQGERRLKRNTLLIVFVFKSMCAGRWLSPNLEQAAFLLKRVLDPSETGRFRGKGAMCKRKK